MKVIRDGQGDSATTPSVVAIGVFDGVHRGHQAIITRAKIAAADRGVPSVVITFDPHPASVLAPANAPLAIESLERRLERFRELGVDIVRLVTFDEAASSESAESFVRRLIHDELGAVHVVVGEDFRFGRDRYGDARRLSEWGEQLGFSVEACGLIGTGERFSSTSVRRAVLEGRLDTAMEILGHPFGIIGEVIHGDARGGSELGFPTANIQTSVGQLLPTIGIYAGAALAHGKWYPAAISLGRRPQFYENGDTLLEAHLPGFSGDIYGEQLQLVFFAWLRGEESYDSLEALIEQISVDVARTRELFQKISQDGETLLT
ncbi:MAG: bifunctional riboflavin kinase/FAD synthetase [Actinomycetota bacterium]|jgi:riboflavin kinase/FMN adenylyltransferase